MKKFLFVLPLFSLTIQSAFAVKTTSLKDDAVALEAGKKAPAVCAQYIFFGEGENMVRTKGSGTLVATDIVATAAHLFACFSENPEDQEAHIKKFTPGTPVKISGFITFSPDATRAIADYEVDPSPENLSHFYEVDSVIIDPSFPIDKESASPRYDRAFIKLKRPVEGIDPIPLYTQGTIPEAKLKIHNQKLINDTEMSMEELLIDAYAYGYGSDINQKFGQKRGIYQPCFVGVNASLVQNDEDSYSSDSEDKPSKLSIVQNDEDSYSSDREDNPSNPSVVRNDEDSYSSDREDNPSNPSVVRNDEDSYSSDREGNPSHPSLVQNDQESDSSDSASSEIEWADKAEVNDGDSIPLTAYFPEYKDDREVSLKIDEATHIFSIDEETNKFNNALSKIIREKAGILGIIDEGDSGGALIIAGKLAGIVAQGNNFGELLARNVTGFSDMPQLYQIYENFYTPLFNVKTGELLSEIPEMMKTLQAHPISDESNLKDFLLFDKKRQQQNQEVLKALTLAIPDLETLLVPGLSLETFESIIKKHSNPENRVTIAFEDALSHFKSGEFEAFKGVIQGKIEMISDMLEKQS